MKYICGALLALICVLPASVAANNQYSEIMAVADAQVAKAQENSLPTSRYVWGGLAGTFIGFGTGHAIQRRYEGKGEMFAYGEVTSLAVLVAGALTGDCGGGGSPVCGDLGAVGLIGFLSFRVWEMVDVWIPPSSASSANAFPGHDRLYQHTISVQGDIGQAVMIYRMRF